MATRDCPFCDRIAAGEYDSHTQGIVSFEPLNPVVAGHRLVVPIQHVEDAGDAPWLTGQVFAEAARLARVLDGDWNLITSAGAAATQTVPHLHVHVVPRAAGDGLHLPWTHQGWRSFTEYAVAMGGDDPNDCAAVMEYDDEADAEEHVQWYREAYVARRTVARSRWERVPEVTP